MDFMQKQAENAAMRLASRYGATTVVRDGGRWYVLGGECGEEGEFVEEARHLVLEDGTVWGEDVLQTPIFSGGREAGPELAAELRAEYRDDERDDA